MRYYAASSGAPYLYHPLPKASEGSGDFEGGGSNSNLENSTGNWILRPPRQWPRARPNQLGTKRGPGANCWLLGSGKMFVAIHSATRRVARDSAGKHITGNDQKVVGPRQPMTWLNRYKVVCY